VKCGIANNQKKEKIMSKSTQIMRAIEMKKYGFTNAQIADALKLNKPVITITVKKESIMKKLIIGILFIIFAIVVATLGATRVSASVDDPTVPETTLEEGNPDFWGVQPVCPKGELPQTYLADAPCAPLDPCVGINSETGWGLSMWNLFPCQEALVLPIESETVESSSVQVSETPSGVPEEQPYLPATGSGAKMVINLIALVFIVIGLTITWFSSRKTAAPIKSQE